MLDEWSVRRLHHAYADIVTRRAWPELHDVMRPTCTLDLDLGDRTMLFDGPGAIGEFIGNELKRLAYGLRETRLERQATQRNAG